MNWNFLPKTWMLKDSAGNPSATLTFVVISFLVMIFCIVGPMFNGAVFFGQIVMIQKPDNVLLLGTLGATFLGYVNRRSTNDKAESEVDKEEKDV